MTVLAPQRPRLAEATAALWALDRALAAGTVLAWAIEHAPDGDADGAIARAWAVCLDDVILRRLARVIWVRTEEYAIGHREVWWALYRLRLVGPWPELGRVVPAGSRPSVEDTRAALPCPTLAELLAWATGGAA